MLADDSCHHFSLLLDVDSLALGRGFGVDVDPFDAACCGVYLHGLAGDLLKEEMGDTGLAATDLAERVPAAIQRLRVS